VVSGCKTSVAVWNGVHTLYGAQSHTNVRHIRCQLTSTRKEALSAAEYMHKMKSFANAMAAVGSPVSDGKLIDYIIIELSYA